VRALRAAWSGFRPSSERGHASAYASRACPLHIVAVAKPWLARRPALPEARSHEVPGGALVQRDAMTRHRDCRDAPTRSRSPQEFGSVLVALCLSVATVACSRLQTATPTASPRTVEDRLDNAIDILTDVQRSLSPSAATLTRCVAVFPARDRTDATHGRLRTGFAACRTGGDWSDWSEPAPISLTGENTAGTTVSSDLIMLIMTEPAIERLLRANLRLAASGVVGPTETGSGSNAELLSYARTDGVLGGADLSAVTIQQDRDATVELYGRRRDLRRLLAGRDPSLCDAKPPRGEQ
jgi:lipid-binding SYLF domain-containing protein